MVTNTRVSARIGVALVALAGLALAGCGGDDAVADFAGGTSSKDKKPIPSTVNASAGSTAPAVASGEAAKPSLEGPAVAGKGADVSAPAAKSRESLRENANEYRAGRSRDPFVSLLGGEDGRSELVDLSVVRLVGVVTSSERAFCILEDAEGIAYVLYKGDRVKHGRVVSIKPDALVCSQTVLGYTTTVQLNLEEKKGAKNG